MEATYEEDIEVTFYLGESDDGDYIHFTECTGTLEEDNIHTIQDIMLPRKTAIELAKDILELYDHKD